MNRRIFLLSLALLALAAALGWLLRLKYLEAQAHERAVLGKPAQVRPVPPPPPVPPVAPAHPADYLEVAQETLFSKDRNPNVTVDAPKPPPPPPPMPALPVYYGQMGFGEPVVILTIPKAPEQKSYRAGDKVGDFNLVAFDRDTITLEWNGDRIERKVRELAPKDGQPQPQAQAAASSGPVLLPGQVTAVTSIISAPPPASASTVPPSLGADMGGGFRACVSGENSAAGTIVSGYRKVIGQSLMGPTCNWEPAK